jgi:hypothetical protein
MRLSKAANSTGQQIQQHHWPVHESEGDLATAAAAA